MIRFVDVSQAMAPGLEVEEPAFSFFDTVIDRYVDLAGEQVFDSVDDLREAHRIENGYPYKVDIERLIRLIPGDYFTQFQNK
ncbi:hypothetical protein BDD43_3407 [Mucilaginibacter gracilis]|uniref:Uncharacterized protein n=1 Tax=Mucilaginibacter gracilis TaxID=423350 RepID=A0A495J2K3_9SPHI|nr:hypothetical protein [Mucilaginibacter gracilis]RKR83205.1 hypothetical protein BDD43_3407 [Mucilaginibacter gracilis]